MAVNIEEEEITLDDALNEFESQTSDFSEDWAYYNSEKRDIAIGLSTPPALRKLLAQVGVPRILVDSITERLKIEGFRRGSKADVEKGEVDELWSWYRANSLDTAQSMQVKDSLIYGRSYITISAPGETDNEDPLAIPDVPIIRVESPNDLFAKVDPRTKRVQWAVRKVVNEEGDNVAATLYLKDRTEFYVYHENELVLADTVNHGLGVVPVVPAIRPSSASDVYGTSYISPEIRSITDAMSRTIMNLQTTSELMATPQRMLFGTTVDEVNGDNKSPLELYAASYLVMENPDAKAMSLPSAELSNYTNAISQYMKLAAAYTGLPPQYLSFTSDSPASAEAIRASEARLVATCERMAHDFGDAWETAMRIALLVMSKPLTIEDFQMETVWRNPATPTYASVADAATKAYGNGNGPVPKEQVRIDMGYTFEQRRQMEEWDKQEFGYMTNAMYQLEQDEGDDSDSSPGGESNSEDGSAGNPIDSNGS